MTHESCSLYRAGNDVFAILYDVTDCFHRAEKLKEIQQTLYDAFFHGEIEIHLSCTFGMAEGTDCLFRHADMALHAAKQAKVVMMEFNEEMLGGESHARNYLWLKKLKKALAEQRILAYFQPIINNANGKIEKYESLVRLVEENGSIASPFFFLDIAKKAKLYPALTRNMITQTLHLLAASGYELSINLSLEDILNQKTVAFLFSALETSGKSDRVVLEITESEGIENFREVVGFINKIKEMGCKIAIDDFGTGYSNFAYLMQMQPDYIKIDGSIIKNIDHDSAAQAIAETVVTFSQKLGIKTIAEFVHSESVHKMVKRIGIDYSQGYLLGEPQPMGTI